MPIARLIVGLLAAALAMPVAALVYNAATSPAPVIDPAPVIIPAAEARVDPHVDTSRISLDEPVELILPAPLPLPPALPEELKPPPPDYKRPLPVLQPVRRALRPRQRLPPRLARVPRLILAAIDWRETVYRGSPR